MELEDRIKRLEDIEEIKQLKALYCEICDDDHNPDRIVTIFTADGIWEGKGIGKANGHQEIRQLFESFKKMMSFSQHMTMNPRIRVNGDRATGTWYFLVRLPSEMATRQSGRHRAITKNTPASRGHGK